MSEKNIKKVRKICIASDGWSFTHWEDMFGGFIDICSPNGDLQSRTAGTVASATVERELSKFLKAHGGEKEITIRQANHGQDA